MYNTKIYLEITVYGKTHYLQSTIKTVFPRRLEQKGEVLSPSCWHQHGDLYSFLGI